MQKIPNHTGKKFERLTVIEKCISVKGKIFAKCLCVCGNIKTVRTDSLFAGTTKSCGCFQTDSLVKRLTTHNFSKKNVYKRWAYMLQRCENKSHKHFKNYGGRGIKVCKRWREFKNFLEDMGEPKRGETIDRINNDGNYEPKNCKWSTRGEQARNRRNIFWIEYKGQKKCAEEWSKITGIHRNTLCYRASSGWPIEKVFSKHKTKSP